MSLSKRELEMLIAAENATLEEIEMNDYLEYLKTEETEDVH